MSQIMFNGIAHAGSMQQLAENYLVCRLRDNLVQEGVLPRGVDLPYIHGKQRIFIEIHFRALTEIVTKVFLLALLSLSTLGFIYCNKGFVNGMLWDIKGSCQAYKITWKGFLEYHDSSKMKKLFADMVAHYVDAACALGGDYRTSLAEFSVELFYKACDKVTRAIYDQRNGAEKRRAYAHIRQAIRQMGNQNVHQQDSVADFVKEIFFSRGRGVVFLPFPADALHRYNRPVRNQANNLEDQILEAVRIASADDSQNVRLSKYPEEEREVLLPYAIEAMKEFFEEMQGVLPETFLAEFNPLDMADMQIAIGIFLTHILSRPELAEGLKDLELQKIEDKRLCIGDIVKQQGTRQEQEVFIRERYLTLLKIFLENHKGEISEEEKRRIEEAAPREIAGDIRLLVLDTPGTITSSGGDTRLWSLLNDAWTEAFPLPLYRK